MESDIFQQLGRITVDTYPHCRSYGLRYLCGGYCRTWRVGKDIHASPADCALLQERAQAILAAALEALEVPVERWQKVELPI